MDTFVEGSKGPCRELAKNQSGKVYKGGLSWYGALRAKRRSQATEGVKRCDQIDGAGGSWSPWESSCCRMVGAEGARSRGRGGIDRTAYATDHTMKGLGEIGGQLEEAGTSREDNFIREGDPGRF